MPAVIVFAIAGLAAVVVLVALSAFFSSSETAIFSLPAPATAADSAGEAVDSGTGAGANDAGADARALARLRSNPHRLLVTILVGNNLVNVAVSSIATVVLVEAFSTGVAVTVATVGVTTVVLVFGEIVPKAYGLGNAERWSLRVARPLGAVEWVLWPLVTVFDAVTRRLSTAIGGNQDVEEPYLD